MSVGGEPAGGRYAGGATVEVGGIVVVVSGFVAVQGIVDIGEESGRGAGASALLMNEVVSYGMRDGGRMDARDEASIGIVE